MRSLLGRGGSRDADTRREQRMELVLALVDRFVHDLGLLMGGHSPDLCDYVEVAAAARLHNALRPALASPGLLHPDFGDYAQVNVEGDLIDVSAPVRVQVEFEDRSSRFDQAGKPLSRCRRRVRLLLLLDPAISRVIDHRLEAA